MSKITAPLRALAAVLGALLLTIGLAIPANAYYFTSVARISMGVNTSTPLHIDNAINFDRQADGTGVTVNWTGLSTYGCNADNFPNYPSGTKFYNNLIYIYEGGGGGLANSKSFPATGNCNPTWTVAQNGPDTGYVRVVLLVAVATHGADEWFQYVWDLWPSGGNVLVEASWTNY